jgi:hypothetical protein
MSQTATGDSPTWQISSTSTSCTTTTALGQCYSLAPITKKSLGVSDNAQFDALGFAFNPTQRAGLHANLVSYDTTTSTGVNAGFNPDQTAASTASVNYKWYAGNRVINADGTVSYVPVEFGAVNLTPTDQLGQQTTGLVGALIVEPLGSTWPASANNSSSAVITPKGGKAFSEFVVVTQDTFNGNVAINYQTPAVAPLGSGTCGLSDVSPVFSTKTAPLPANCFPTPSPPSPPTFTAVAGTPVRFRVLYPGGQKGQGQMNVFEVHGHQWQELPYVAGSTAMGNNRTSQVLGMQQLVPNDKLDLLIPSAGGVNAIPGDYKYGSFLNDFNGLWGILHVTPKAGAFRAAAAVPQAAPAAPRAKNARVYTAAQKKAAADKAKAAEKAAQAKRAKDRQNKQ